MEKTDNESTVRHRVKLTGIDAIETGESQGRSGIHRFQAHFYLFALYCAIRSLKMFLFR
jgi:hypothetical protein